MVEWARRSGGLLVIRVHVQPAAKRNEVAGTYGDALKVRLTAPPVDGRANAALCDFIALRLGVAGSAVAVSSGHTSRRKLLSVVGAPDDSEARLLAG
ncbi:MAG TPA: DUF167 domain-containing protein [Accumulibacter sp.]|uniref:DUF167 domain-containing protein n=1 Tax=Accumulibacter sp. TaxID=2053492 RepID=UPI00287AE214|nr:DUF167 domain-containing protein [Accumulibacter sp.]MDS4055201.1 DUF167 domain-containing protein [Accumulibacter sp.]HMV04515.1 DUF167 domain-containing protein [Accumulibacter sp.]HMW62482.1 DUF167 domain-containing protein [Accumulibacter sp.]HMW79014.1 DUF167 domain-containing protein [Accumulibacter sp.]HMX67484.1 DUF167 domain-containing protein [Accumulibacter sp.]